MGAPSVSVGRLNLLCQRVDAGIVTLILEWRYVAMRMLVDFNRPLEPFNTLVKNGTAGQKIQQILEEIKPEAVYFSERGASGAES